MEKTGLPFRSVVHKFKPQILKRAIELRTIQNKDKTIGKEVGVHRLTISLWMNSDDVSEFLSDTYTKDELDDFIEKKFPDRFNPFSFNIDKQIKLPGIERKKQDLFDNHPNLDSLSSKLVYPEMDLLHDYQPNFLQRSVEMVIDGFPINKISNVLKIPLDVIEEWMEKYSILENIENKKLNDKTINSFITDIFSDRFDAESKLEEMLDMTFDTELEKVLTALKRPNAIKIPLSHQAKQAIFNAHPNTIDLMRVTGEKKIRVLRGFKLQFAQRAIELKIAGLEDAEIADELNLSENTIKRWFDRRYNFEDFQGQPVEDYLIYLYPERFFQELLFDELCNNKKMPILGGIPSSENYQPSIVKLVEGIFNSSPRFDDLIKRTGKSNNEVSTIFRPFFTRRIVELKVMGLSDNLVSKVLGYKSHISMGNLIKKYNLRSIFGEFRIDSFSYQKLDEFIYGEFPSTKYSEDIIELLTNDPRKYPKRSPYTIKFRSFKQVIQQIDFPNVDKIAKYGNFPANHVKYAFKPFFLRRAIELRQLDTKLVSIGDSIGYSSQTVGKWLKQDDVKEFVNNKNFDEKAWEEFLSSKFPVRYTPERIVREYLDGKTIVKLYREYGHSDYIPQLLKEYLTFIPRTGKLSQYVKEGFTYPISTYLEEVLIGELLGDSHVEHSNTEFDENAPHVSSEEYSVALRKMREIPKVDNLEQKIQYHNKYAPVVYNTRTGRFSLDKNVEKEEKWGIHISEIFDEEGYPITQSRDSIIDAIQMHSPASVELYDIRNTWYDKDGIKIVPEFKLTPNILLHWHIGDGGAAYDEVRIYTHCFTLKEVEYLATSINDAIGINVKIRPVSSKDLNNKQYIIVISSQEHVGKYFEYLEHATSINVAKEYVPHKFETKWSPRTPEMKQHGYLYLPDEVEKTGLSSKTVINKNKNMLIEQTEKMLGDGKNQAYIARTFGVHISTVKSWIKIYL